jgi:hypothetical protein
VSVKILPVAEFDATQVAVRMIQAINGDEMCCFFNMMMEMDLSQFDHRDVPTTQALANQKALSLEPFDQWLCDLGYNGHFPGHNKWDVNKATSKLVDGFEYYCDVKKLSQYQRLNNQQIGKRLSRMFKKTRKRGVQTDDFYTTNSKAVACYELGTLHDFRNKLIDTFKLPYDYFTDDEVENVKAIIQDIGSALCLSYDTKELIIEFVEKENGPTREDIIKVLDDYGGDEAKVRKEWEIDGSNPPIYNFVKQ